MKWLIAAASFLFLFAPAQAFAQEGLSIQIIPNTPVASGQQVTIYGSGFCGLVNCSDVAIKVGLIPLASGVKVGGDGQFQSSFAAGGILGSNTITATQTGADGGTIAASTILILAAADYPPGNNPINYPNNPLPENNSPLPPASNPPSNPDSGSNPDKSPKPSPSPYLESSKSDTSTNSPQPPNEDFSPQEKEATEAVLGFRGANNFIKAVILGILSFIVAFYFSKRRRYFKR